MSFIFPGGIVTPYAVKIPPQSLETSQMAIVVSLLEYEQLLTCVWLHFQTCAHLQAELQMAVDHLTIDPTSYEQAQQDAVSMWQNQSKHVTFTEDTKNYSGKLESNPWEQTCKFFGGRQATGKPDVFQNYCDSDDDPSSQHDLDALEDVSTARSYTLGGSHTRGN